MKSGKDLKKMSWTEHAQEEKKRAAKFGQAPLTPVSLARNFRVEGLQRFARPEQASCSSAPRWMSRVVAAAPRLHNPHALDLGSDLLLANIEVLLKQVASGRRDLVASELLEQFSAFAARSSDDSQLAALRNRVLEAAFDEQSIESVRGGNAAETDEGKNGC